MDKAESISKSKELFESLKSFANTYHRKDIESIHHFDRKTQYYAISVNSMFVFSECIEFAHSFFVDPNCALETLNKAFAKAAEDIFKELSSHNDLDLKSLIKVRLVAFPECPEIQRKLLPKSTDVGRFLCITGTIIRCTMPKMLEFRKKWKCTKCRYEFTKDVDVERNFEAMKPIKCENPDYCFNHNFSLCSGITTEWCRDYQEVKIQEHFQYLFFGRAPRSMCVILFDDLIDSCQPGNDVIISGILHTRWQTPAVGIRTGIELVIVAHNVEVKNNSSALNIASEDSLHEFNEFWNKHSDKPLVGRNFILSCFCPQVYGLYIVKLAIAIVLAGGVQRLDSDGKIRGDLHLLLVGDPGTAKSQFLKYAAKISQRSVIISGVGSTNAGLTAAAVKSDGKWQLEAGALVLADGGVCCIDEFGCIKEQDRACVHEAMEQQTVSIAKGGLVCKLNTQCTILAATNPKMKYDKESSLSVNTALSSPLLSRFDVIIVLLDNYSQSWDERVSLHVLNNKQMTDHDIGASEWSLEKIKMYFSAIRILCPQITPDSTKILHAYYLKQRSYAEQRDVRITPRFLQSLIRLSQGHAKLMFRTQVLPMDAIVAVTILESSMLGCGIFEDHTNALHTKFPDDPQAFFEKQAHIILNALDLQHLADKVFTGNSPMHLDLQPPSVSVRLPDLFSSTQSNVKSQPSAPSSNQVFPRHSTQKISQQEPKDSIKLANDEDDDDFEVQIEKCSKYFNTKSKNKSPDIGTKRKFSVESDKVSYKRGKIVNRDDSVGFNSTPQPNSLACAPKHTFRKDNLSQKDFSIRNSSEIEEDRKTKDFTDDITTLSELNEIFSVDIDTENFEGDEPEKDSADPLELFKRFAFRKHSKNQISSKCNSPRSSQSDSQNAKSHSTQVETGANNNANNTREEQVCNKEDAVSEDEISFDVSFDNE